MTAARFSDMSARLEAAIGRVVSLGSVPQNRPEGFPASSERSASEDFLDARTSPPRERAPRRPLPAPQRKQGEAQRPLPPLPESVAGHDSYIRYLFVILVLVPAFFIVIYYGFFAANQYVSEFKFSVTESNPVLPSLSTPTSSSSSGAASGSSALAGIASAISGGGLSVSNAAAQNYIVVDYLMSRQAVEDLQKRIKIKSLFDGPETNWDWLARFSPSGASEDFLTYWNNMTTASYDPITGIATVRVRAFSREKSLLIANTMVKLAEELVNGIARRAQLDAMKYAEGEVTRAEGALAESRKALETFREQEGVIEPAGSVSTNNELIKALRANLVQLRTEAVMLNRQNVAINSATSSSLNARIAATEHQLEKLQHEVSKDDEAGRKLMKTVARYEKLDLDRQYAQAMLLSARQTYDQARANAAAQHLYLTPFVRPALPENAAFPKRLQSILLKIGMWLGIWVVVMMLAQAVREHL